MRDYAGDYERFTANLREGHGECASAEAIGGAFDQIGYMERQLLIQWGLEPHHRLVDLGCGIGRLAVQLRGYLKPECYLGIDIVPSFLEEAHRLCPNFRFALAPGLSVPAEEGSLDMICAFSLFTHLEHQHTYLYLKDIWRALVPGGCLIFSFLSFACQIHWEVFLQTVDQVGKNSILTQYIEPTMLDRFAMALDFQMQGMRSGDERHIALDRDVSMPNGTVYQKWGTIGQSVAIWKKPKPL